jgi:aryl-alcohol dehydrogenase-like predicted oxidoreductase
MTPRNGLQPPCCASTSAPVNSRLALGTVRFGMPYGVDNNAPMMSLEAASSIVTQASTLGFTVLDTAVAYGESEARLGEIGVDHWRVVSKLPEIPSSCANIGDWIHQSVLGSLERLRTHKLYGLLLHEAQQLAGPHGDAIYEGLSAVKRLRLVEKIGVSIYAPDELFPLCARYRLDLVQASYNVIDRRLVTSGWLSRLHAAGTEVHARSLFLQGLLLMPARGRPAGFERWQTLWNLWESWLAQHGLSAIQGCLGFALAQPQFTHFVVGIDSVQHLQEIVACAGMPSAMPPNELASEDADLVNPSRWRLN